MGIHDSKCVLFAIAAVYCTTIAATKVRGIESPPNAATSTVPTPTTLTNPQIAYQGYLATSGGAPVNDTVTLSVAIYDALTGGSQLWAESQSSVQVSAGVFSIALGSVNPLNPAHFSGAPIFIGVSINGEPELPRTRLLATPFALRAAEADHAHTADIAADGVWAPVGSNIHYDTGNVGIGTGNEVHSEALKIARFTGDTVVNLRGNGTTNKQYLAFTDDGQGWNVGNRSQDNAFGIGRTTAMDDVVLTPQAQVGIGVSQPLAALHISRPGDAVVMLSGGASSATGSQIIDAGDGRMRLRADGSVIALDGADLVGINTANPDQPLTVNGNIHVQSGGIVFPDNSVQTTAATAGSGDWTENGIDIHNSNAGNVGIGTASPSLPLEVAGDFGRDDGPAGMHLWGSEVADRGDGALHLKSGGAVLALDGNDRLEMWTGEAAMAKFQGADAGNHFVTIGNAASFQSLGVAPPGPNAGTPYLWSSSGDFFVGEDPVPTLMVRGRSSGMVGINKSSPAATLDVNGTAAIAGILDADGGVRYSDGTVQNSATIPNGSVTTSKLADGAVTAGKVSNGQLVRSVNAIRDDVTLAAGAGINVATLGQTITVSSTAAVPTLDVAYDGPGGGGSGRTIVADAGAVVVSGPGGLSVTGAVGIGTNAPVSKLDVIGDARAQRLIDGDNGSYFLDPSSSSTAGVFAGSVGIGTTNPNAKLDISGDMRSSGNITRTNGSGSARSRLLLNTENTGGVETFSTTGKLNFQVSTLVGNPQNATLALLSSTNGTQAKVSAYVNTSNQGIVVADAYNVNIASPLDPGAEIWYAALHGPEAAVYVRGTARLVDGRAVVALPSHFAAVAASEGITAVLTPQSADSKGLAVVSKSLSAGIEVRELMGGAWVL